MDAPHPGQHGLTEKIIELRAAAVQVRADTSPFGFNSVALSPDTLDQILDALVRVQVVALAADLNRTLSDPTQAWDIAVVDFNDAINQLMGGA
jgi:hypothetical protein